MPRLYMCKGSYFSLTGKSPFSRLVRTWNMLPT